MILLNSRRYIGTKWCMEVLHFWVSIGRRKWEKFLKILILILGDSTSQSPYKITLNFFNKLRRKKCNLERKK